MTVQTVFTSGNYGLVRKHTNKITW